MRWSRSGLRPQLSSCTASRPPPMRSPQQRKSPRWTLRNGLVQPLSHKQMGRGEHVGGRAAAILPTTVKDRQELTSSHQSRPATAKYGAAQLKRGLSWRRRLHCRRDPPGVCLIATLPAADLRLRVLPATEQERACPPIDGLRTPRTPSKLMGEPFGWPRECFKKDARGNLSNLRAHECRSFREHGELRPTR